MEYDLKLEKIIAEIHQINAKNILIQLADGLKPRAKEIQEQISNLKNKETKINYKSLEELRKIFGEFDLIY